MANRVFFSFGHISTLAAVNTALSLDAEASARVPTYWVCEEPFLQGGKILADRWPPPEYHQINQIFAGLYPWTKQIRVPFDVNYAHFRESPVRFLRAHAGFRKLERQIRRKEIAAWGPQRQVFASHNTRLWRAALGEGSELNLTEHGSPEYRLADFQRVESPTKRRAKRWFSAISPYPSEECPARVYLQDGGHSRALEPFRRLRSPAVRSLDFAPLWGRLQTQFWPEFARLFPEADAELRKLDVKFAPESGVAIYLPTGELPDGDYPDYLRAQVSQLEARHGKLGTCLIKPHPADRRSYDALFSSLGLRAVQVHTRPAKLVPAELLASRFMRPLIFGSFSMSLLYGKWWGGIPTLLTDVPANPVTRTLADEYRHLEPDFRA